jgi:glycosyltransferase involved in cell wall biosynthesis
VRPDLPSVSVILPVWNDARHLSAALHALALQTYPTDRVEVIVVDNGSIDRLDEVVSRFPRARWLVEPYPGSYAARNRGIEAAHGEVLAFTDADCIPAPDWLEHAVRALRRPAPAGMVAGRIEVRFSYPGRPNACELYDRLCSFRQVETLTRYGYGATANLITTMEVMKRVGPFDGRLLSGGDREWCNRLANTGLRRRYCPKAVVHHPARRELRKLVAKSLRVTVATGRLSGRGSFGGEAFHHVVRRPRRLWREMRRDGHGRVTCGQVMTLYAAIKALQLAERLRIGLGGAPRR